MPSWSIFDEVKDTNKREQKQTRLHFAERKVLRRSRSANKPDAKAAVSSIMPGKRVKRNRAPLPAGNRTRPVKRGGCGAIRDATTYRRIRIPAPHPKIIFAERRFRKTGAGLGKERTAAQTLRPEAARFALRECGGSGSEDISGDRPPNVPAALCSGKER